MKNKNKAIAFLGIGLLLLASCTTKYAQRGGWPDMYGYTDAPIDSTTYQVTFSGNSVTGPDVVDRYALYRAAEITVDKGFDYFVVIDMQQNATTTTSAVPGAPSTEIQHDIDPQTGKMVPVAVTTQGYTTTTQTEHSVTKTIRMFKGARPADNASTYDAKSMLAMMGPTIQR